MAQESNKLSNKKPIIRWVSFSDAEVIRAGKGKFYKLVSAKRSSADLRAQLVLLATLVNRRWMVGHISARLCAYHQPNLDCPHVQEIEPQKGERLP